MVPLIEVRNLSKRYRLGTSAHQYDRLSDRFAQGMRRAWNLLQGNSPEENGARGWFWGLHDVSFDVYQGEVVGVIGSNGAGKSTLLKILSRITDPTLGYGKLRGRSASLLEVGTGFHPDLTGRENIYLNGSILGMSKAEVRARFDEIVAFSEISRFLDTPVKRYSSGMYVRLAFAVAAHLQPEILIVDEVLAVGDMAFQKKCLGKMSDISKSGRTVLFVSHNMAALQNLCDRGIVLRQGELAFDGGTKEAIDYYVRTVYGEGKEPGPQIIDLSKDVNRSAKLTARLQTLELYTSEGLPSNGCLSYGAPVRIHTRCRLDQPVRNMYVLLSFNTLMGDSVFVADSGFEPACVIEELAGEHVFVCEIPSLSLIPGEYMIHVALWARGSLIDRVDDATRLTILPADYYGTGRVPKLGRCVLPHHWYIKDERNNLLAETDDVSTT
jgi:lipopolysaccharide transport system ATP-binding protein